MYDLKLYRGGILNPVSETECEFWRDGAIVVDAKTQKIVKLGKFKDVHAEVVELFDVEVFSHTDEVFLPGLYDMSFHWVQDNIRDATKELLLDWLKSCAYPEEVKFADPDYAQEQAKLFSRRLLSCGTIGGMCYSSVHGHALEAAMKEFVGDFVIGDCLSTMNVPDELALSPDQARKQIEHFAQTYGPRYAFSPRFAMACDPEIMRFGADCAKANDCFIQSHLSENQEEIRETLQLAKQHEKTKAVKTYGEIYDLCGLLTDKTFMAHAIHLNKSERALLSAANVRLVHCPSSNAPLKQRGLGSGLFDYQRADRDGLEWALGSDVGAAPFLSMFDVMRSFVTQNQGFKRPVTYTNSLYRATLAGATLLGVGDKRGNVSVGKDASFIGVRRPRGHDQMLTAEDMIRGIVSRNSNNRIKFEDMVTRVILGGKEAYLRD